MAWTYTDSPATVPADAVRLFIGDTDTTDQLVSDAVVAWALSVSSNSVVAAAARLARILATKFARFVDETAGDTKQMLSQRAKAFLSLAKELEGQAGIGAGGGGVAGSLTGAVVAPIVTGVDLDEMFAVEANPDRPPGNFPEDEPDTLYPPFPTAFIPQ